jgi:hypothetical protein
VLLHNVNYMLFNYVNKLLRKYSLEYENFHLRKPSLSVRLNEDGKLLTIFVILRHEK